MKKEEAINILKFLEYVQKNMPIKDKDFEYHTNTIFDCKCVLQEEIGDEKYLNREFVEPTAKHMISGAT